MRGLTSLVLPFSVSLGACQPQRTYFSTSDLPLQIANLKEPSAEFRPYFGRWCYDDGVAHHAVDEHGQTVRVRLPISPVMSLLEARFEEGVRTEALG